MPLVPAPPCALEILSVDARALRLPPRLVCRRC